MAEKATKKFFKESFNDQLAQAINETKKKKKQGSAIDVIKKSAEEKNKMLNDIYNW